MSFLKSKAGRVFVDPLLQNNPIGVLVLGICSALAVTVQLKVALVMSGALTFVLVGSNLINSAIRNFIPNRIRIITFLAVIASLVIIADLILKAFLFDISLELSVFVGLIITNCIVMGRAEAFATGNDMYMSFWDGLGNSMGYSLVLCLVGAGRELFGSGTLLGFDVVPQFLYDIGYKNNGLMVLPAGAFILLGLLIWFGNIFRKEEE